MSLETWLFLVISCGLTCLGLLVNVITHLRVVHKRLDALFDGIDVLIYHAIAEGQEKEMVTNIIKQRLMETKKNKGK